MKFNIKKPCEDCPFRSDKPFYLPRAKQILDSILNRDASFHCHKTLDYDNDKGVVGKNSQHCAGALIFLEKQNKPNQIMRIAERLGLYHKTMLEMDSPVHRSAKAMIEMCNRKPWGEK